SFPPRDRATPAAPRPGEAERTTVSGFAADPLLRAHLKTLRDHFGADASGPFDVQRASLVGGATGLLVSGPHEADPIVLVVDRDRLLFVKQRPTAGILAPVRHVTIAPLHIGGVVLFGFVEALGTVAARMWADDSNPFGEFEVLASDRCDALSAAYSAGFGWVVVCATPQGARGARMTDDITMPWGHRGVPLGAPATVGPATVSFDSPGSFVLLERADSSRGQRVLGYRFDARGMDLWAAPVTLDGLGTAGGDDERIRAESLEKGGVRIEPLRGGAARGRALEVSPDGKLSSAH
ncbi:MAG: hypothetical protein ACRENE_06865, partial [Polyangiaceae bacterium]